MSISDFLELRASSFKHIVQYLGGTRETWLFVLDNADDHNTDFFNSSQLALEGL